MLGMDCCLYVGFAHQTLGIPAHGLEKTLRGPCLWDLKHKPALQLGGWTWSCCWLSSL